MVVVGDGRDIGSRINHHFCLMLADGAAIGVISSLFGFGGGWGGEGCNLLSLRGDGGKVRVMMVVSKVQT